MNIKDPGKVLLGLVLLVAGTLLAIKGYPTPAPIVLASAREGMTFRPGQTPPQSGLPWEVFVGYFRTLLATMVVMHIGALLVYSGLTRPLDPSRPA